jgi:predicted dehydrogenase
MPNIGVIGCGYWGPNLIRNFHSLGRCKLLMCSDTIGDRLEFLRSQFPTVQVTQDTEEILRSPRIDAVAIATPVATHFGLAKEALLHDKDVLVEKPMTTSTRQAEELVELAQLRRRVLMVDHTFVYTGAVRKLKELLLKRDLGELYYIDSVRANLGLFQRDTNVLWDLAVHDVSIIDFLCESLPVSVSAVGACHINDGIENVVYLTAFYENNFLAHVHVNWLAPAKVRRMLLCGSKKMAVYDDVEPSDKVKVYDKGVEVPPDPEAIRQARVQYRVGDMYAPCLDSAEALKRVTSHFLDCIETHAKPLTDGEMGLRVVRVLEAADISIHNGNRKVFLPKMGSVARTRAVQQAG